MQGIAVDAARDCLNRSKAAKAAMQGATDFTAFEAAWTDFLIMANRVYAKLEQGAKGNGTSFGWFGDKKHARRKIPLLSYVKNARDVDEHGLVRVTERSPGTVSVNFPQGANVISGHLEYGNVHFELAEPKPIQVTHTLPSVRLVEVTNRGDKYPPPGSTDPITVAEQTLSHLAALTDEAAALV